VSKILIPGEITFGALSQQRKTLSQS